MAVYQYPRATCDIDLLILSDQADAALNCVREIGFDVEALPMSFAGGAIQIKRISKFVPELQSHVPIDFLLVTPAIEEAWRTRRKVAWAGGELWTVSLEGLIALKKLRSSKQDIVDIEHLANYEE